MSIRLKNFVAGQLRLLRHEEQRILSERGKVWLIRLPWKQETAGSNPAVLTNLWPHSLWVRILGFQPGESGSSPGGATNQYIRAWESLANPPHSD